MKRQPGVLTLSEDDRRALALRGADCAEWAPLLFEAQAPSGTRPRDAIDGARAFARGDMRIGQARTLAAQAHAAARRLAIRRRCPRLAAGHTAAVAHMAADPRGAAAYAAIAVGLAASKDPTAAAKEMRRALHQALPTVVGGEAYGVSPW